MMQAGWLKRVLSLPFYRIALPLLRRGGLARASAYDWAAFLLEQRRVKVTGIIDAGAFDGTIALHLADLFPHAQVYAFEPVPASFAFLEDKAQRQPRLKPFQIALSDQDGKTCINVNRSPGTSSILKSLDSSDLEAVFQGGADTLARVECPMITVDTFLEQNPESSCQLMKVDVQGYDLKVLRGAQRALSQSIRVVIAEFRFFAPAYQGDTSLLEPVDTFLASLGFQLFCIPSIASHPTMRRALEADGVWVRDS